MLYHREVVGDEQIGQIELLLQVLQEVQDLRLDGHVQRGDRFVGHDELRAQGQRSGEADPLSLTSREGVWVPVVVLRVEPDQLHELLDLVPDPVPRNGVMQPEGFADDVPDRLSRIQ